MSLSKNHVNEIFSNTIKNLIEYALLSKPNIREPGSLLKKNASEIVSQSKKNVKMGELIITENPENLNLLALGSCIGLIVYDIKFKLFGVAHTVLPEVNARRERPGVHDPDAPAKYTDAAVKQIVKKFREYGIQPDNLRAKIVGGAQIFDRDLIRVGEKNLISVKKMLEEEGVKLESEVVGGNQGISILHIARNGIIKVKKEGKIVQI
jgi:chemotaxis protein CheD